MAPGAPISEPSAPSIVHALEEQIPLSGIEAAKQRAAFKAVDDHFHHSYKYIGIGSGSTVVYVVQAIAAKGRKITDGMIFVPTYDRLPADAEFRDATATADFAIA
jgi:ribose 5-phosphate isomerase A